MQRCSSASVQEGVVCSEHLKRGFRTKKMIRLKRLSSSPQSKAQKQKDLWQLDCLKLQKTIKNDQSRWFRRSSSISLRSFIYVCGFVCLLLFSRPHCCFFFSNHRPRLLLGKIRKRRALDPNRRVRSRDCFFFFNLFADIFFKNQEAPNSSSFQK